MRQTQVLNALLRGPLYALQNVEAAYYEQSLQHDLQKLGYEGQYVAQPGGGAIGVATFWMMRTFKLLKVIRVQGLRSVKFKASSSAHANRQSWIHTLYHACCPVQWYGGM